MSTTTTYKMQPNAAILGGYTMRNMNRPVFAICFLAALSACSSSTIDEEEAEDLGVTIEVDMTQLFDAIEETAAEVASLDATAPASEETCYESVGTCESCSSYTGTSASGTFGVDMTETPCGETWEAIARTRTYTVENGALSGSWSNTDAETYDWSVSGDQEVEYIVSSDRPADRVYDASWALSQLDATTVGGALDSYTISSTYSNYADVTSTLDLSGTAEVGEGTLTVEDENNNRVVCDVSREDDLVTIICD